MPSKLKNSISKKNSGLRKSPIFVALDVDDESSALSLATKLQDYVGGFKVGPRLTYKYGARLIKKLARFGPVFVDNKYHDIPSTVVAALKVTYESGASFATVHASNGGDALKEFAELEATFNRQRPFKILCVTVLTSFNEKNLPRHWAKISSPDVKEKSGEQTKLAVAHHVYSLAQDVIASGLTGIVCSPEEVALLRNKFKNAYLVTPGIRLPTDAKGDQVRVMSPREAIVAGASALVVGRPIIAAANPVRAAKNFATLLG